MPTIRLPLPAAALRSRALAASPRTRGASRRAAGMEPEPTSIPAWIRPASRADLDRARPRLQGVRRALSRASSARSAGRRRAASSAGRRDQALRGARGSARPHHVLCRARLCRRHHRSAAREVLRRRAGAADGGVLRPAVLPARAEPPRRRARSRRRCAEAPLAHYRPWLEDIRKEKPLPARRPDRAALPREVGHRPRRLEPALRRDDRRRSASTSTARS